MRDEQTARVTRIGPALYTNKLAQVGELVAVFVPALAVVLFARPLLGENPLALHGVTCLAILLMLGLIAWGLRLRGQGCEHFGLTFRLAPPRTIVRTVWLSLVVCVAAVASVVVAAVVMANIVGMPEGADMSKYVYLHGNLPMLIFALLVVYVNASFGEEVIYRAFLINRIAELGSRSKAAWVLAVVISSIMFGLIHSDWAIAGMVQMCFMGLVLGVSYLLVRRNLWVTILAHGYMDTILLLQLYFGAE